MRRRLRNRPFVPLNQNGVRDMAVSINFEGPNILSAEIAVLSLSNNASTAQPRQNSTSDQGIGKQ